MFGVPEVLRNLVAAGGGLFRLPRVLPRNIAMELVLTGRLDFSAERAHHFGWVNALTEESGALEGAVALAAQIEKAAPLAVRESRKIVLEAAEADEAGGGSAAEATAEARAAPGVSVMVFVSPSTKLTFCVEGSLPSRSSTSVWDPGSTGNGTSSERPRSSMPSRRSCPPRTRPR